MARIRGVSITIDPRMNWRKPDTVGHIVFWSEAVNYRTYEVNLRTAARALEAQRLMLAKIEAQQKVVSDD
jgi:hypothetical protein